MTVHESFEQTYSATAPKDASPLIASLSAEDFRQTFRSSKIQIAANGNEWLFSRGAQMPPGCDTHEAYKAAVKESGLKYPLPGESSPRTGDPFKDIANRLIDAAATKVQAGMSQSDKDRLSADGKSYMSALEKYKTENSGAWLSLCAPPMPPEKPASVKSYEQKVRTEAEHMSNPLGSHR